MAGQYKNLIATLKSSDDLSTDDLIILSSTLQNKTNVLDECGLNYDSQAEGVRIDLSAQKMKIFKSKESAVNRLSIEDFDKNILIIEDELIYYSNPNDCSIFFENVYFWHKLKNFLVTESLSTHDDVIKEVMIFLSETMGKVDVGYTNKWLDSFYDLNHQLKQTYYLLDSKINKDSDFKSFFKDNFIKVAQDIAETGSRYTATLKSSRHIFELSEKDYDLFKSKFSFEEFRNDLEKEKEKYLREYQSSLTDFISKVSTMPIQFGAYIFLIIRFSEEIPPLLATLLLIVAWSIFKVISVNQLIDNVDYLKIKFNENFDNLVIKSKIPETDINKPRTEVNDKFKKTLFTLKAYNVIVILFTLFAFAISIYFITKLICL